MKFDQDRDRYSNGLDLGYIVTGKVEVDPETREIVLVDSDGVGFSIMECLMDLIGKEVRFTIVPMVSILKIEQIVNDSNSKPLLIVICNR